MDFIRIYYDLERGTVAFEVSLWVGLLVVAILGGILWLRYSLTRYRLVKLDIALGNIGKVELRPNTEDLQIAHRIWTELVTRKAAIAVDPDHDVIVEIYDSWYALFTRIRELVSELPADLVRKEDSTREISRIAIATLNDGLRPHLTKWQAKFRNWYENSTDDLKTKTPQELQKEFPEYAELIDDMLSINAQLVAYAAELRKLLEK